MQLESQKEGGVCTGEDRKDIWKNNDWNISKFDENYKLTNQRSTTNS